MNKPTVVPSVFLLLMYFLFPVFCWSGGLPQIEAIRGSQSLSDGSKTVVRGCELNPGDRIQTNANTSVRFVYPDRSHIMVGRSSDLEVLAPGADGAQWVHLHRGSLKGVIVKPANKPKKPRFVIRTKTLLLGVRGTEFDVRVDDQGDIVEVHTLDGEVEVVKGEQDWESGSGILVHANEFIQSSPSGVEAPKKFDRVQYLKEMKVLEPDFNVFIKTDMASPEELKALSPKRGAGAKSAR